MRRIAAAFDAACRASQYRFTEIYYCITPHFHDTASEADTPLIAVETADDTEKWKVSTRYYADSFHGHFAADTRYDAAFSHSRLASRR